MEGSRRAGGGRLGPLGQPSIRSWRLVQATSSRRRSTVRRRAWSIQTLAEGPEGANIVALGDALRALKRAGLEADARRLAVEALFAAWPRTSGG